MAIQWLRRACLLAACASALLLAACGGGGTIDSQLTPSRVVAFGDATADLATGARYTVNSSAGTNIWTEYVAAQFAVTVTSSAKGNARVVADADAAGNTATLSVSEQIDAFLAGGSFSGDDLVLVSAGTSDVIAEVQAAIKTGPTQTTGQAVANAGQAGRDLAAQVQRLVSAGARHVGVAGPYDLSRSVWGQQQTSANASVLNLAVRAFNDQMLIALQNAGLGSSVLYLSQEAFINEVTTNPGGYGITNITVPVCTPLDAGPGIGTGTNQLNSSLCTTGTLVASANPLTYLFADRVYLTPTANSQFGAYAYGRLRDRW
jgi:phospholipase/lecithinase/hemolysin